MRMTLQQSFDLYGNLMVNSIKNYKKNRAVTKHLIATVTLLKKMLYQIDNNPRLVTLTVMLHYSEPKLEEYASLIWDALCYAKH